MEVVYCPRCNMKVVTAADGACPGCSHAIPAAVPLTDDATRCPECTARLSAGAILCVACGFHLQQGSHLATAAEKLPEYSKKLPATKSCPACHSEIPAKTTLCVECGYHFKFQRRIPTLIAAERAPQPFTEQQVEPVGPTDDNPYAAPRHAASPRPQLYKNEKLTERDASWAKSLAGDAKYAIAFTFAGILCVPRGFVLLFWYSFRLYQWHRWNRRFEELRNPNSFSSHGQIAVQFQESRWKLTMALFLAGGFWFAVAAVAFGKMVFIIVST